MNPRPGGRKGRADGHADNPDRHDEGGRRMEKSIEQWNAAAALYAEDQEKSAYADANRAVVRARFGRLDGEKVLDLGCGYGGYTD